MGDFARDDSPVEEDSRLEDSSIDDSNKIPDSSDIQEPKSDYLKSFLKYRGKRANDIRDDLGKEIQNFLTFSN